MPFRQAQPTPGLAQPTPGLSTSHPGQAPWLGGLPGVVEASWLVALGRAIPTFRAARVLTGIFRVWVWPDRTALGLPERGRPGPASQVDNPPTLIVPAFSQVGVLIPVGPAFSQVGGPLWFGPASQVAWPYSRWAIRFVGGRWACPAYGRADWFGRCRGGVRTSSAPHWLCSGAYSRAGGGLA